MWENTSKEVRKKSYSRITYKANFRTPNTTRLTEKVSHEGQSDVASLRAQVTRKYGESGQKC